MKKTSVICLMKLLLYALLMATAYADGETWHCETCDAERDTAFCPVCGAKRPDPEPSVWYCPSCGKEISGEYSFCPDDGTAKTTGFISTWPKRNLTGSPVTLKPQIYDVWHYYESDTFCRQAYLGPDKNKYPGAGSYRINTVNGATAILREGNYILVDLVYHGTKKRVVYFQADTLQDVPASLEITTLKGLPAKICKTATFMTGPGDDYEKLEIDEQLEKILVPEMEIIVFFECNGWVYTEFGTDRSSIRAWLPVDAVTQ